MFADRARGSRAAVLLDYRTGVHSARQSPPSAQPQLTPPSWERPHQRASNKVYAPEDKSPRLISGRGIKPRCVPYPMKASLLLLVVAIVATSTSTVLAPGSRMVTGASAAPCTSEATTTSAATGGGAGTQHVVNVTSTADVNLTSIFDCEGGNFEVYWSGEVDVTDTIVIGNGTTVRIFGDDNSIEGDSGLSDDDEVVANLTSGLALPLGLTSAAVGMGPPNETAGAEKPASFGSMFYVDGGILILEDLIVRGGFADNTTAGLDGVEGFYGSGGGIYAVNSSVFVTRCDFNDNFAENMGGGIFAVESTVEVVDAMFISCTAGFMATFDDEDQEGAGGGIYVDLSEVRVDGCLFEGGYATTKGGGISHQNGNISVLGSVFYNNNAGGINVNGENPTGEGADLALSACDRSFDGLAACDVNDTVFVNSHVAKKGGAVAISSGDGPATTVEFYRCTVDNSSAGIEIEDDAQGEGGAFVAGSGVSLLLSNCTLKNNSCGKKGGVVVLSSGTNLTFPGGIVIIQNSSFESNTAHVDNGGVINVEGFARVIVQGGGNVFEQNACGEDGAVFAATTDSSVLIEGGTFKGNNAGRNSGVVWSKGNVTIEGGTFFDNDARADGGLFLASDGCLLTLKGGRFENNTSVDGGVAVINSGGNVRIENGHFSGNIAEKEGGAFTLYDGGVVQVTGGTFSNSSADFGGFAYVRGKNSYFSCTGASLLRHYAVDGGSIYVVDHAVLDWACDIESSSALAGPAIYARHNTTVVLQDMVLRDNTVARGSAVFVVNSILKTHQVDFLDSSGSFDLWAVQVDQASTYIAEDTSFIGFEGEAVIFSEGELYLDDCDFSGSTASVLVYSEPGSTAVIRNAILRDNNYVAFTNAGAEAGELPNVTSLTNANFRCGDALVESVGGDDATGSSYSPCSRPVCLDGDVGVYCECYYPKRSPWSERCVGGDATALNLSLVSSPETTFYPGLLEGNLRLSYESSAASSAASSTSSSGGGGGGGGDGAENEDGGVVWTVNALLGLETGQSVLGWTIVPSTGLLFPGESVTLRVATRPDTFFDGTGVVTFDVTGEGADDNDDDDDDDNDGNSISTDAQHAQRGLTSSSLQDGTGSVSLETNEEGETSKNATSFTVTFFHCDVGTFWNRTDSSVTSTGEYDGTCERCTEDGMDGDIEGLDCSKPGATLETLPIHVGYWRAATNLTVSRACYNEDACRGGSIVETADDYCNGGYEGVVCSVCSPGYGRGAANQCHACSDSFKGGMFFFLSVVGLLALVVIALLAVYLVGGRDAVSSTVANTKQTAIQLQRRGASIMSRSDHGGVSDFRQSTAGPSGFSGSRRGRLRRVGRKTTTPSDGGSVSNSGNNNDNGRTTTGLESVSDGGVQVAPRKLGRDISVAPAWGDQSPEPASRGDTGDALAVSGVNIAIDSGPVFGRAYGGSSAADGGNKPNERNVRHPGGGSKEGVQEERQGKTTAGKIGAFLTGLPLSKFKIVIVVWQISAAFADVTNVGFPPIYEKFLSILGIFSLDLGWLLSATCVASGVGFHEKLLMVTIGPFILLGLLGVTFHLGSRSATPRVETLHDLRSRSSHGGTVGSRASSTTLEATSAPTGSDGPCTKSGDISDQGEASGEEKGGKDDPDNVPAQRPSVASGVQNSWVIHMSGAETGTPQSSASLSRAKPPVVISKRSLRSVWKAGQGDKTNPEQNQLWELFARHTTMTLIILYLVYSQVSTVIFQTFACDDYPEIGKHHLRADSRIECNTDTHTAYMVYAGVMVCIYPFGIPTAFFYILLRQRSSINPPTDKSLEGAKGKQDIVQEKINQRANDESVAPTSFLWGAYYPSCYYFEVFECIRRLLLTGLLVFVSNSSGQVAYACIFAFLSLVAFEIKMPHIDGLEIQLYRTGCLVIFFTNFLALIIQAEVADAHSNSSAVYSVLLILVHVFFVLSICWNSWATMKATFSRRHVQGVVLGVDLVDEENADKILGPEKEKGNKDPGGSQSVKETKAEDEEELPSWQDKPAVPEFPFDSSSSSSDSSRHGNDNRGTQPGTGTTPPVPPG